MIIHDCTFVLDITNKAQGSLHNKMKDHLSAKRSKISYRLLVMSNNCNSAPSNPVVLQHAMPMV